MEYLRKPAGIMNLFIIIMGIIVLGLSVVSRPGAFVKSQAEPDDSIDLWKVDFYLSMVVIGLIFAIASIVGSALLGSKADSYRLMNASVNVLIGVMLVISAGLLLGEYVYHYNGYDGDHGRCSRLTGSSRSFRASDAGTEILDAVAECNKKEDLDSFQTCLCVVTTVMKYDLVIAATSLGIFNAVFYFVAAGLSLRR